MASALFDVLFVLQITPQLRLEHVSESIEEFTGYRAEEYLAEPTLWLSAPDIRDRETLLTALNAEFGAAIHLTLRWSRRGAGTAWAQQITRKVRRPDGSVAVYGALNHITDQQIAEAQAGLDGRYSMVAEDASDVVLRVDLEGAIVWVSDSVRAVAGWSPHELIGRNAGAFLDDAGRAVVAALAPRVLAGESRSGVVVRLRTPQGAGRFVSLSARPVYDGDSGHVVAAIASWRDVDDLVRARLEAESERQILRATLDAQLDPQVVLESVRDEADRIIDFQVVEVNPAACEVLDVIRADVVGQLVLTVTPHIRSLQQWDLLLGVVRDRRPLILNDQLLRSIRDGQARRFDLRAVPVHDGLSLTWRDVTERHRAAVALAESEARYRLMLEESSDMVSFHAPDGAVEWISPAVERLLGWRPEEATATLLELIHSDDVPGVRSAQARLLDGQESAVARFRMRTRDHGWRWLEATARAVRGADDRISSMVVFSHDVQEQMRHEQELDNRVRTDELTGLANRREVIAQLSRRLSPDDPRDTPWAVAFCDLDGFKAVNDGHGHSVGDALLQVVAARIRDCLRAGDTVARVGGDEILLVLDGIPDLVTASRVAEKVRGVLSEPVLIDGKSVPVTVSIGVTLAAPDDDVDGLIARADRAMYRAKQAGRDRVVTAP